MEKQGVPRQLKLLAVLCCAAYVVYALYFNVIGSNATIMMEFFGITEGQQGFILTVQSIGALVGTVFLALWGERYNKIHGVAFGLALLAVAGVMIGLLPRYAGGWQGYILILALVAVAGFGYNFVDVMVNSAVTDNFKNKDTVLPIVHAFHGIGMILAPLLVTAVIHPQIASTFSTPFLIIGLLTVVVFFLYVASGKSITEVTPYADMTEIRKRVTQNPAEIFKVKETWILLAAAVTYFAFQIGMSAWLPTYCQQNLGMDYKTAGQMITMFFVGALVMRFITPIVLKKIRVYNLYVLFGVGSCACMGAALLAGGTGAFVVLVTVSGFFQGAHAALLVLIGCAMFPERTASASSVVSLAIGIASFTFPLVMGMLAEHAGFTASMGLIIACMAASAVIMLWLGRRIRSK